MTWNRDTIREDSLFLQSVTETAQNGITFAMLPYEVNREIVLPWLEQFAVMIGQMMYHIGHLGKKDMNYLEEYYNNYDEEGRLLSRHGQVEYLTTMRYIEECLKGISDPGILEVGAGTGRYSVTLAKQGLRVTAVDLIEHNLDILRAKLDGTEPITAVQGNAMDLSRFADDTFDLTMLLGPMYHLYTKEDKHRALSEAVRVTKTGGYILVAYCMNEPTVIQYVFGLNNLHEVMELKMITPDCHCISEPKDLFELVRTEDITEMDEAVPVKRIKLVATDGATNYKREFIDAMDDETFGKWMDYHFTICERQDLIGASHHTLDILKKTDSSVFGKKSIVEQCRDKV